MQDLLPDMRESLRRDRRFHMRSTWNCHHMMIGKPLTDRRIKQYWKRGFYSAEFRQQRADYQAKRNKKRSGNFDLVDGRMIYRP